jgi:hypothetical protein
MAKAAGGTSQRLKPGRAIMRSFDRKPGSLAKVPVATVLVMNLILVIGRVLAKRRKGSSIKQHEGNLPSFIFA